MARALPNQKPRRLGRRDFGDSEGYNLPRKGWYLNGIPRRHHCPYGKLGRYTGHKDVNPRWRVDVGHRLRNTQGVVPCISRKAPRSLSELGKDDRDLVAKLISVCTVRHILPLDHPLEDGVVIWFHAQRLTYAGHDLVLRFTLKQSLVSLVPSYRCDCRWSPVQHTSVRRSPRVALGLARRRPQGKDALVLGIPACSVDSAGTPEGPVVLAS